MNPFTAPEYARRVRAARAALDRNGLDALLVFAQESHYYLFGYDGGGYVYFQCAVLATGEQPVTLLCRRPDVAQARDTSRIDDIRVWEDAEAANPAGELRAILAEKGLEGQRIGIELDSYGMTGANHQRVREAMTGFCELVDASHVVRTLRLVKSPAGVKLKRRVGPDRRIPVGSGLARLTRSDDGRRSRHGSRTHRAVERPQAARPRRSPAGLGRGCPGLSGPRAPGTGARHSITARARRLRRRSRSLFVRASQLPHRKGHLNVQIHA